MTESMVLFWHDHFATGIDKVLFPQSMYIQNDLFRDYATGSFRSSPGAWPMTRRCSSGSTDSTTGPGTSTRTGPASLELFTGVDHYTQDDVAYAARAFTGYYTTDGVTSAFNPAWHDNGYKVFLGQVLLLGRGRHHRHHLPAGRNGAVRLPEALQVVRRRVSRRRAPRRLAQTLRDNDYQIAPVLRQIFLSEHFFDIDHRGSVIKDGVDHYVGLIRMLGMGPMLDLSDPADNQSVFVTYSMFVRSDSLQPPNVAGWPATGPGSTPTLALAQDA
ncbi:MAG: DUF1800 family protein [Candidatus Eisenbacteria bacterium]